MGTGLSTPSFALGASGRHCLPHTSPDRNRAEVMLKFGRESLTLARFHRPEALTARAGGVSGNSKHIAPVLPRACQHPPQEGNVRRTKIGPIPYQRGAATA